MELPPRLDWSSKRLYDLADYGDRRALYERVLHQALQSEDLQVFLDESLLCELWPMLWFPQQIRDLWEGPVPATGGALLGEYRCRCGIGIHRE
ncbi:Uncharacterised protein [Mycobacteroides abscessus]|uniref:hypothetical protein n=1 Tax=Mycobacteroides abscessus TaxID=36809 RepID=UPI0005DB0CAB|nr:hypothetical protein [Mycobacteroides abscessus]CPU66347.1 Uncharacterised protein [Mycobacteroides abscessus]CPX75376.1 Uncharacterised protein [Mycobacteroides abscessus]CPZ78266.1 Uncharacterised protein [Mycobacteroides abscessus]